ncbi:MAG TPA: UMP kinase [Candidatus Thalassarchaeaceae archaeon]|nr:UMP kinase [Candidatus Thalassarchaeaceae archaeon]
MATVVLALGGSLLRPELGDRHQWLEDFISIVKSRLESGDKMGIVVGGGAPAREGIELARTLIDDESHLDRIGIAATRLNATIIKETLEDGGLEICEVLPESVDEAIEKLSCNGIVVMGGTVAGQTTDTVAIKLAIGVGASRCIIATNVARVHSEDPRENPEAESFGRMTLEMLQEIVGPAEHASAGRSKVVDPVGVGEAVKHGLPLAVLDGRDSWRIQSALEGGEFGGTLIEG